MTKVQPHRRIEKGAGSPRYSRMNSALHRSASADLVSWSDSSMRFGLLGVTEVLNVTGEDRNGHQRTGEDIFLTKKCLTVFSSHKEAKEMKSRRQQRATI